MVTTLESIDHHITAVWQRLKAAKANGKPVTIYQTMIDTLLEQRQRYNNG